MDKFRPTKEALLEGDQAKLNRRNQPVPNGLVLELFNFVRKEPFLPNAVLTDWIGTVAGIPTSNINSGVLSTYIYRTKKRQ